MRHLPPFSIMIAAFCKKERTMPDKTLTRRERQQIAACDAAGLRILLVAQEDALLMLRYLAEWLRQGGAAGWRLAIRGLCCR